MIDKILSFKVFCLESYKAIRNLLGPLSHEIFVKNNVFGYVTKCYDALHANGRLYIVSDIDEYISNRKGSESNHELSMLG